MNLTPQDVRCRSAVLPAGQGRAQLGGRVAASCVARGLEALDDHVMDALGNRMGGYSRELFDDPDNFDPAAQAAMIRDIPVKYPHIMEVAMAATTGQAPTGRGCDEQFEFEFALDILLDGFGRLRQQGWPPPASHGPAPAAGHAHRWNGTPRAANS